MKKWLPGRVLVVGVGWALLAGGAVPAWAQSLDYGALQQLFGEPVTTSAIGTPQRARDVPADIEIVTADDIRRSGAIDIPGVLSHVLGVDVSRWSLLGADVSVRGYNSPMTPRLLVLIDGRQVYIDDWGRTEWAALPVELSEIRQIEIVKGPNSALFGFNAAGGVINIITFNPLYDRVNTASITWGTQGYRDASAVASDRLGEDVGIRLSAGGTMAHDYASVRDLAATQALQRDTSRDQISIDLHWRINAVSELEVQATHSEDQRLALSPEWIWTFTHNELNSLLSRYISDTKFGVVTGTLYSDWSYVAASSNPQGGIGSVYTYQTQLTVAQLQDEFQLGADHTIRLTAEYRHNSVNSAPDTGGTVSYDVGSLGGMWNWSVLPSLSLTAASRIDLLWLGRTGGGLTHSQFTNADWSHEITEPAYSLGLVWHPVEADRFRVTTARGSQLPSLLEFGGLQSVPSGIGTLNSSPMIQPTVVTNYEGDWDHDFAGIGARSRVAVFYQTTREIQSIISPFGATFSPSTGFVSIVGNVGNSREVGAEFSLKGDLAGHWRWQLAYSPRLVRDQYRAGASILNTGVNFSATTPRHVFDASLGWSRDAWEVDGFLRVQSSGTGLYVSLLRGASLLPVGPSVAFDARVAYRVTPHVTLSLSGQNVFVSTQQQTPASKLEQQLLGRVAVHF